MSNLHAEVGLAQISKAGEELCGDNMDVVRTPNTTIIVLSDGLGSGVKANILATLTTKIASSMLRKGIPLEDVVETIAETLPVCKERKIAYSTLHIIKILDSGLAKVVEFDCPASFLVRRGKVVPFPTEEKLIAGKLIREGQLYIQENDVIVAVSDGVVHAGIGGLLKMGWGWRGIADHLASNCLESMEADDMVRRIINCCEGYYLGQAGDDSTAIAVKVREPIKLSLLTGPPSDKFNDDKVIKRFMAAQGLKVVSGGTTAHIVSTITGKPLKVELGYEDPAIPPIGYIPGLDLVTEGVLTLTATIDRLNVPRITRQSSRKDGATQLAKMLLKADDVRILAGSAVNPAHQNPNFPVQINIKAQVLSKLRATLEGLGKTVAIEWF